MPIYKITLVVACLLMAAAQLILALKQNDKQGFVNCLIMSALGYLVFVS